MQFNVPQFTEVEDRVIGPLTIRQFLILLGAGGVTFLGYSFSKNIPVTVITGIFVFIPALVVSFGQFNGRHLYRIIPVFFKFATLPKRYIFEKEVRMATGKSLVSAAANKQMQQLDASDKDFPGMGDDVHSRLRKIEYQLQQRSIKQQQVVESLK